MNEKNNSINQNNNLNSINILQNDQSFNVEDDSCRKTVINKISDLFLNICNDNVKELMNHKENNLIKPFLTNNPSISIKDYLERLCTFSLINISTIILIVIYIDRICNINKFKLTYYNIHKLILSSMVVAIKYNEDNFYSNETYAKLGGIPKSEMAFLEYYFVTLINFNLFIKEELFYKYNNFFSSSDNEEEIEEEEEDSSEQSNNSNLKNIK